MHFSPQCICKFGYKSRQHFKRRSIVQGRWSNAILLYLIKAYHGLLNTTPPFPGIHQGGVDARDHNLGIPPSYWRFYIRCTFINRVMCMLKGHPAGIEGVCTLRKYKKIWTDFGLCRTDASVVRAPHCVAQSGLTYSGVHYVHPEFDVNEGCQEDWPAKVYFHPTMTHLGAIALFLPGQSRAKYHNKENATHAQLDCALRYTCAQKENRMPSLLCPSFCFMLPSHLLHWCRNGLLSSSDTQSEPQCHIPN